jgi:hypothetical protein
MALDGPWKAEKDKKNIDISETIAMMSGSSRPKLEVQPRSVPSARHGDVKRSPNAASRSAGVGLSASGDGMREDGETKSRLRC